MKFWVLRTGVLLTVCLTLSSVTLAGTDGGAIQSSEMSDEAQRAFFDITHGDAHGRRFDNSRGELPDQASDYYWEYAIYSVTQRLSQERIVAGGPAGSREYFYTNDNFAHYHRIDY